MKLFLQFACYYFLSFDFRYAFPKVRDQVSYSYKITDKFLVVCIPIILILGLFRQHLEDEQF